MQLASLIQYLSLALAVMATPVSVASSDDASLDKRSGQAAITFFGTQSLTLSGVDFKIAMGNRQATAQVHNPGSAGVNVEVWSVNTGGSTNKALIGPGATLGLTISPVNENDNGYVKVY